jgi:hypothetical protein
MTSGDDGRAARRRPKATVSLEQARGEAWLPVTPVSTMEQAAEFVDALGAVLLFPTERAESPSLWEAVAGPDAEPFAEGMGPAESLLWEWKDELPRHGLAWYGKFLLRRGSLLSPRLLAALYPGDGEPSDHHALDLSREAHEIAETLVGGPLTSAALRELVGDRSRYVRAIGELHHNLLVTSAGVLTQRAGWPAAIIDLTCRLFDVGGRLDPEYAAQRFLDTRIATTARDLSRGYGWPLAAARERLDGLVAAGAATRTADGAYHRNEPVHPPA